VLPEYLAAMQEREKVCTTYIGNGVAIPHGVNEAKKSILKSGISVIQFPEGVDFGDGNIAYLVIGIAGKNDEHLAILANLAELISDEDIIKPLYTEQNKEQLYKVFTQQNN
jgi:mannitol/fructose-specific phosphotransferase system IIA component